MSNFNKKVVLLAVLSCIVSACQINTKPDHPQIRESFSERRAPRDNGLAESGALGDNAENNFKGVRNEKVGSALNNGSSNRKNYSTGFLGQTLGNTGSSSSTSSSSSSSSSGDESFFSKLWNKLFSENEQNFDNKYINVERSYPVANLNQSKKKVAQGSSSQKLSYYEKADEILPANLTKRVETSSIDPIQNESKAVSDAKFGYMLANGDITHSISSQQNIESMNAGSWQNTMSDSNPMRVSENKNPVVDLDKPLSSSEEIHNSIRNYSPPKKEGETTNNSTQPEEINKDIPSIDELRKKSEEIKAPELKDVPKTPEIKKVEPKKATPVKPKPYSKKKNIKKTQVSHNNIDPTKYRDPINDVNPHSVEIKEPNAHVEIDEGRHVVRGSLGTIKK